MPKKQAAESVFEHEFTAKVNKEGDHHEVILRSADSKEPLTLVMRNTTGAKGLKDGASYTMSLTENAVAEEPDVAIVE